MVFSRAVFPLLCAATLLTGCGYTTDRIAPSAPAAAGMHGRVKGGQQPVVGATVSVYELGSPSTDYAAPLLASTTSDSNGNFEFNTNPGNTYVCPAGPGVPDSRSTTNHPAAGAKSAAATGSRKLTVTGDPFSGRTHAKPAVRPDLTQSYVYVVAAGGDAGSGMNSSILLAAGLGACTDALTETVEINEVSTVVFGFAMLNFDYSKGQFVAGDPSPELATAIDIADTGTFQAFVDLPTGLVQPNTVSTAPGGTSVTIDAGKIYSLANTIGSCVNSTDDLTDPASPMPSSNCQALFAASEAPYTNTLDAVIGISAAPFYEVSTLWAMGSAEAPFGGGLGTAPNDWTIGISYTTNAMGLGLFAAADGSPTSSNIDIDSSGRIWFPSNKSGATGVGYFDPTDLSFNGPFGGADLTQPQYVALDDSDQLAFVTDLGSSNVELVDTTPGGTNGASFFTITSDGLGGSVPMTTGPLFINSNESLTMAYNDSNGGHDMILINPDLTGGLLSSFEQAPTGLTINTTLGADPNDPADPVGLAATSGPSTACGLEVGGDTTMQGALPGPLVTTTNPCISGGAATAGGSASSGTILQDEVTTATTANLLCSQLAGTCTELTVMNTSTNTNVNLMDGPVGVALDGGDELWIANSGNTSISAVFNTSGTGTYSTYSDRPYLHDQANGGTMIKPTGIAIDGAGNIWVSNATCATKTDTSCSFTLSEEIGIGFPTITPLSSQDNLMQGDQPQVAGGPVSALSKSALARTRRRKGISPSK